MIRQTSLLYDHDEASGGAALTLDRPDRMNALTFAVHDELYSAVRRLRIYEGATEVPRPMAGGALPNEVSV